MTIPGGAGKPGPALVAALHPDAGDAADAQGDADAVWAT
jgi:hypothetical protein